MKFMPNFSNNKPKTISFIFLIILMSALFIWFDYLLPEKTRVFVTGTEVKRVDKDGPISAENPADGPTHDVYYIYTTLSIDGKPSDNVKVFKNEDTGWGLPFYLKFDSADIQAKAQMFNSQSREEVTFSSYGWRINMLSVFPNVISIKATKNVLVPFSLLRAFVLLAWLTLLIFLIIKLNKFFNNRLNNASIEKTEENA